MTDNSDSPTDVVPDVGGAAGPQLPLRTVAEQLSRVLEAIGSVDPIELALLDAQGLLLAEQVFADAPLPGFDSSAVDGYAVRAVDLTEASADNPIVLPVVGDVMAGQRSAAGMGPGLCMRIVTGAPVPPGADAVIPLEETDGGLARVAIRRSARTGDCLRRAGEDLAAGALALGAGATLGPQQLALLAAVGHDRVVAQPRPRVVVISTGSELVEVGKRPGFGEVTDCNSYLLAAAARDAGADAYRVGIVPDDHARLLDLLDSQLSRSDLIVTTGGLGSGASDIVKDTLTQLGSVEFTSIAMQPGSTHGFGTLGRDRTPIFCLSGNPVAALVSFEVFVRPAIRKLLGKRNVHRQNIQAIALERMESREGSREFRRGLLHREPDGRYSVSLVGGRGSHLVAALAASNCLVIIEEDVTEVVPGSRVTVQPLMLAQR
ncbi:MAG TPA: gephyrin-like molybdotransferase Glp [Jatrophihabitans sp.]|nr:gephyrin-like molybdotransferase Glp [Jatrophihabitans sp.]